MFFLINYFLSYLEKEAANEAIALFEESAEAGEEFGDNQVRDRSRGVIPQVYYNKSLVQYNQEDHSAALESLDRAIELNENYTLAYYQRAIVLNNSGASLEDVLEWFDRAIEVGQRVGDSDNVGRSQRRAGGELIYQAVQRMDENRMADALRMLDRAERYVPNSVDLHYRYAEVYNDRGSYNQAIEHANRALELETGGVTDRAKIYFELGIAFKAQEQISDACDAFENAAYGDFRDPALYELEHELECEGYAASGSR
jgi:Tfp pilus assembly protein PilF